MLVMYIEEYVTNIYGSTCQLRRTQSRRTLQISPSGRTNPCRSEATYRPKSRSFPSWECKVRFSLPPPCEPSGAHHNRTIGSRQPPRCGARGRPCGALRARWRPSEGGSPLEVTSRRAPANVRRERRRTWLAPSWPVARRCRSSCWTGSHQVVGRTCVKPPRERICLPGEKCVADIRVRHVRLATIHERADGTPSPVRTLPRPGLWRQVVPGRSGGVLPRDRLGHQPRCGTRPGSNGSIRIPSASTFLR